MQSNVPAPQTSAELDTPIKGDTPYDPKSDKLKQHLRCLGLSESIYSSNSDVFYLVLTPEQDKVDYISFKDIIDKT